MIKIIKVILLIGCVTADPEGDTLTTKPEGDKLPNKPEEVEINMENRLEREDHQASGPEEEDQASEPENDDQASKCEDDDQVSKPEEDNHLEQYIDSCNHESIMIENNIKRKILDLLASDGKITDLDKEKLKAYFETKESNLAEVDSELTALKMTESFFDDGKNLIFDCGFTIDRCM